MVKQIANVITGIRILSSILMLFFPVFSVGFYSTYALCGFSDMIDGTVARKTKRDSKFGEKFDTLADFIFCAAALFKVLPNIRFPKWAWVWVAVIAMLKIGNIVVGFVKKKGFLALHTTMNKMTGFFLFLFPLTLSFIALKYTVMTICGIATFAALQEGYYIFRFEDKTDK